MCSGSGEKAASNASIDKEVDEEMILEDDSDVQT